MARVNTYLNFAGSTIEAFEFSRGAFGTDLMGTDVIESMGHPLSPVNTVHLNLEPDSRAEADRLFGALSEGASSSIAMHEQFCGDDWGSCIDRFGVSWMINHRRG